MNPRLARWKPAVTSHWLLLLAGVLWTTAGAILVLFAYRWLATTQRTAAIPLALGGLALAIAIDRYGFSRIAMKNIWRIRQLSRRACIFAFQEWHSYLVMGFMMGLGIFLRHSGVPKHVLAPVYVGLGGALFLSSCRYYRQFLKKIRTGYAGYSG